MADENVLEVLGEHTMMGELRRHPELYAEGGPAAALGGAAGGRLPPYMIVVGDRRRVAKTAALLDEGTAVALHAVMAGAGLSSGRVDVVVGEYRGTPVAVCETGMGTASFEIIVRELVSRAASSTRYGAFRADARYVVRVGSSAGVNAADTPEAELVRPFDVLVASHTAGLSGSDLQALSGVLNFTSDAALPRWRAALEAAGIDSYDDGMARLPADPALRDALERHARAAVAGTSAARVLGAFSKDSLYSESEEEAFMELRARYGVGCTEMEASTLFRLARLHDAAAGAPYLRGGMVCFCIGVLPGASFVHDREREQAASRAALVSALEALHEVAEGHRVV